jgi:hypothetical protein
MREAGDPTPLCAHGTRIDESCEQCRVIIDLFRSHKVPCCERDTDGDGNCDRHPPAQPMTVKDLRFILGTFCDNLPVTIQPGRLIIRGQMESVIIIPEDKPRG